MEEMPLFDEEDATPYERQVTPNGTAFSPVARSENKPTSEHKLLDMGQVYGLGGYSQYNRVLLCMVGLPARGKSYIVKMLTRYLTWSGFPVKAFNAGNLRRHMGKAGAGADFFDKNNKEMSALRERIASQCMEEAISWLEEQAGVCVAIFDATNTTRKRRAKIVQRCGKGSGLTPVFVESICDDPEILKENYRLKLGNDDYQGMDPEKARTDFLERVRQYEEAYEAVEDEEHGEHISYIKMFNVGQKIVMHRITGYLTSQVASYLSNCHICQRSIWLTRHAETEDQLAGKLGSVREELTPNGQRYGRFVAEMLRSCKRQMLKAGETTDREVLVLLGTAAVHAATLNSLKSIPDDAEDRIEFKAMSTSLLNELDGGICNGMTYEQIKQAHPDIWAAREQDKLNFRYPGAGGESYADVIGRLRPIIIELERQRRSVLVISHLAVQRCLYAYFTGCPIQDTPYLELGMHTVVELRPKPLGAAVRQSGMGNDSAELHGHGQRLRAAWA
jgi:broad specificity phosphatase PhoE